jgi:hypothetical protein
MRRIRLFFSVSFPGFCLILFLLFSSFSGIAQDTAQIDSNAAQTGIQDSAGINKTIKSVFSEAKEAAGQGESTLLPVLMILLVLCVVGFALWLSFRGPSAGEKRKKVMDRQRRK